MAGTGFTKLHTFKTIKSKDMDPDEQITFLISRLKGTIQPNWQVLAPTPDTRIIYFQMEEGYDAQLVKGYQDQMRRMLLNDKVKKT